ncbi:hypothetical protein HQN89_10750 [Paenibacillus frigoriresistens]|uniref:hypothetical protein n=1 Tax=Paenibacillus alginolyticus TaxID=59839 RepID=UPI001563951F|nr:hypothetical protein [Paenibacillus frigoriresistens]NRF91498.1 hypothetical protein [Paenibacillus frigoriresistens]
MQDVPKELREACKQLEANLIRAGRAPWAEFRGPEAVKRGEELANRYEELYGRSPEFAGGPWRKDQTFEYAVRLDG